MIYFLIVLGFLLVAFIGYMLWEAFSNDIHYHQVQAKGLPERLSIFYISDTHKRKISSTIIRKLYQSRIDLIIIGGDFADRRTSEKTITSNLQALANIAPIYFVWGNNDKEVGEERLLQLFKKYNVTLIENNSAVIPLSQNNARICGIDFNPSLEEIKQSVACCQPDDQIIFVSHDPYLFATIMKYVKPLLMLGGHLHGGQIRLGKFSIAPKGGFGKLEKTYTLVSNGYGTTLFPLRLGAKAECHIIDIEWKML